MGKRGQVTKEVKLIAMSYFGRDITTKELRLLPYLQYALMNEQRIDMEKINMEELGILNDWLDNGWIIGDLYQKIKVRKDFWDFMCRIIFESYVNYEEDN